jgi:copper(I)-binding protein
VNRALRAATLGVLLLSPVALSACSAGQVTQTAGQDRDKAGTMAEVGPITLRGVQLTYPRGGSYAEGDDAELVMAIINEGTEDDALVDVTGDDFRGVEFDDNSATPTGGTNGGSRQQVTEIAIPAGEVVYVDGQDRTITLTDLQQPLTTGQSLELTLTFENAGEVTVKATVATPGNDLPRGEGFDFHHEEG